MPRIQSGAELQTVITTFEMTPGTCQDLMDELSAAYRDFISKQSGFILVSRSRIPPDSN